MTATDGKKPKHVTFATTTTEASAAAERVAAVFSALPGGVIDGSEIVILMMKPSMWRPVFDSAPWLIAALALGLVLVGMGQPLPGLSLTATAQVMLLLGLVPLAWSVARWMPRWHLLTNRRIIDLRGIRTPQVTSCPLVSIRNTYLRRTPLQRLASVGTILFVPTEGCPPSFEWRTLANPDEVHAKVRRAIENALDSHAVG